MRHEPSGTVSWPFAMLLTAIGGLAAAGGVPLGWWEARAIRTTEIFGREILAERTLAGWSAWGGVLSLACGAVALAAGLVGLVPVGPALRRRMALLGLSCGVLALVGVALGLVQGSAAARAALGGLPGSAEATAAGGLVLSGLGGVLTGVGGALGWAPRVAGSADGLAAHPG